MRFSATSAALYPTGIDLSFRALMYFLMSLVTAFTYVAAEVVRASLTTSFAEKKAKVLSYLEKTSIVAKTCWRYFSL